MPYDQLSLADILFAAMLFGAGLALVRRVRGDLSPDSLLDHHEERRADRRETIRSSETT